MVFFGYRFFGSGFFGPFFVGPGFVGQGLFGTGFVWAVFVWYRVCLVVVFFRAGFFVVCPEVDPFVDPTWNRGGAGC